MKWGHSHDYVDFILQFQLEAAKQDKGSISLICICQENTEEVIGIKASIIISSEWSFLWSLCYLLGSLYHSWDELLLCAQGFHGALHPT